MRVKYFYQIFFFSKNFIEIVEFRWERMKYKIGKTVERIVELKYEFRGLNLELSGLGINFSFFSFFLDIWSVFLYFIYIYIYLYIYFVIL